MKKLLLASAAVLALTTVGNAAIIANLGINPTSQQGHFSNEVGGAQFEDDYLFTLAGSPQFFTFSSATNVHADPDDFITAFTGQLFSAGADADVGGGDDVAVAPPVEAVGCPGNPTGCQILAGQAVLDAGTYFLRLTGIGGGTSGYGGDLTTSPLAAVPIPGMALAVPAGFIGLGWLARRRKQKLAAA